MHVGARAASRRLAAVALIAGLAAGAAGCGSAAAPVALPKKPSRAQLVGEVPARPGARQLVVSAYEGYWRATSEAVNSGSASRARAILAGYIPRSAVPGMVRGLRQLWRHHEMAYGGPVFHIMKVALTSKSTAAVHDCIDLSHAGFQDRRTGVVVGGIGQSHDYLITTLVLRHGQWLVTGAIPVVRPCAY